MNVVRRGFPFLQLPGPTNIPARVQAAMHRPAIEMSGAEFQAIKAECLEGLRTVLRTNQSVAVYACSGHGAWEAALANTLSPGDKALVPETGNFSDGWRRMAVSLGIDIEYVDFDWRRGIEAAVIEQRLREDRGHAIKAVLMVHTDTATGVTNDVLAVRRAIDAARHPALFMVDTIASLGSTEFAMDAWGVDVAVGGSQKGLMGPPGLGFCGVSAKAMAACKQCTMPRNYWDWRARLPEGRPMTFCGTAPEHMIFGMLEGIRMVLEEGVEVAIDRQARLARAVEKAVETWEVPGGVELYAQVPERRANTVSTVLFPEEHDVEAFRKDCFARYNVTVASGLNRLDGKSFRIGHLGDVNEAMIIGALGALEMTLGRRGVPHNKGGVQAAIDLLAAS